MKTIIRSLMALAFAALLFGCEKSKDPGKGSLDFAYASSGLKSDIVNEPGVIPGDSTIICPIEPMPPIYIDDVYAVLVTISDASGKVVMDKTEIPLYNLTGEYISKQISLNEGKYLLTDFLVISNSRKVLYATPKAGSPKAGMVSQPLPIAISIEADITTHIVPEVVSVYGINASDLGYATFGFVIVDPVIPPGEKICLNIDVVNGMAESVMPPSVPARVQIFASNGQTVLDAWVSDSIHTLYFPAFDQYTFLVESPNFPPYKAQYTLAELKPFMCMMNQRLIIALGGQTDPPMPAGFDFGIPFNLMQGQIIPCNSEVMKIQFVNYTDSRCPKNMMCNWAGTAAVTLNVFTGSETYENISVTIGKETIAGPYTIKLVNLLPYPAEITIPERTAVLLVNTSMEVVPMNK